MTERHELLEMLKRVEEKLYAGWNLYSALAFLYWIPVLSIYMAVSSTSWFIRLSGDMKGLVSITYWSVAVALSFTLYWRLLRRYMERLGARLRGECGEKCCTRRRPCTILTAAAWPLGLALAPGIGAVLEPPLGAERAQAAALLAFITIGTLGVSLAEYCTSRRKPLSLIAPTITGLGILLTPLIPPRLDAAYSFAGSTIIAGYSIAAILYVLAALRHLQ